MNGITVRDVVKECGLDILGGQEGLMRVITTADINRPGLALAGYLQYFDCQRIQVVGTTETEFVNSLSEAESCLRWETLFKQQFPCLIVARSLDLPKECFLAAEKFCVPVLRTSLPTTRLIGRLTDYLEHRLAPSTTVHGVLVDVHGVGVLLTGESGIGKSETALELIHRGHRLVADDAVEITKRGENILVGRSPEIIRYLIEVRGLGILDVKTLFGTGAIRYSQAIEFVIKFEEWEAKKSYDRLGFDEQTTAILGVNIPQIILPIRPGRNIAAIVEVAAMNHRLKRLGYNPARRLLDVNTEERSM